MPQLECAVCNLDKLDKRAFAEFVLKASIETARDAYQQAGISGLCHAGREEAAISAMQMLDLDKVITEWEQSFKNLSNVDTLQSIQPILHR